MVSIAATEPPGTYSRKILKCSSSELEPRYCTICGCCKSRRRSISRFRAATMTCFLLSISLLLFDGISTCLTAMSSPVIAWRARKTLPNDPWPMRDPCIHLTLSQESPLRNWSSSSSGSSPSSAIACRYCSCIVLFASVFAPLLPDSSK